MDILQITVILVVSTGLEMINSWGGWGGGMVVASMYPASRIVVKQINCEYISILVDNMLLLNSLRYDFCKCSVILEHRYVYTKRILTIIANIKVCSIQMLLKHHCVYSKRFDLIINSCTYFDISLF